MFMGSSRPSGSSRKKGKAKPITIVADDSSDDRGSAVEDDKTDKLSQPSTKKGKKQNTHRQASTSETGGDKPDNKTDHDAQLPATKSKKSKKKRVADHIVVSSSEASETLKKSTKMAAKVRKKKEVDDSEDDDMPLPPKKTKNKKRAVAKKNDTDDDDDDDGSPIVTPATRRRRATIVPIVTTLPFFRPPANVAGSFREALRLPVPSNAPRTVLLRTMMTTMMRTLR
jgi:hypothetical protein